MSAVLLPGAELVETVAARTKAVAMDDGAVVHFFVGTKRVPPEKA